MLQTLKRQRTDGGKREEYSKACRTADDRHRTPALSETAGSQQLCNEDGGKATVYSSKKCCESIPVPKLRSAMEQVLSAHIARLVPDYEAELPPVILASSPTAGSGASESGPTKIQSLGVTIGCFESLHGTSWGSSDLPPCTTQEESAFVTFLSDIQSAPAIHLANIGTQ